MDNINEDKSIDHEVRLRMVEDFMKQAQARFKMLQDKLDSQFNLIVGTIITSCIGVALHMSKLL